MISHSQYALKQRMRDGSTCSLMHLLDKLGIEISNETSDEVIRFVDRSLKKLLTYES